MDSIFIRETLYNSVVATGLAVGAGAIVKKYQAPQVKLAVVAGTTFLMGSLNASLELYKQHQEGEYHWGQVGDKFLIGASEGFAISLGVFFANRFLHKEASFRKKLFIGGTCDGALGGGFSGGTRSWVETDSLLYGLLGALGGAVGGGLLGTLFYGGGHLVANRFKPSAVILDQVEDRLPSVASPPVRDIQTTVEGLREKVGAAGVLLEQGLPNDEARTRWVVGFISLWEDSPIDQVAKKEIFGATPTWLQTVLRSFEADPPPTTEIDPFILKRVLRIADGVNPDTRISLIEASVAEKFVYAEQIAEIPLPHGLRTHEEFRVVWDQLDRANQFRLLEKAEANKDWGWFSDYLGNYTTGTWRQARAAYTNIAEELDRIKGEPDLVSSISPIRRRQLQGQFDFLASRIRGDLWNRESNPWLPFFRNRLRQSLDVPISAEVSEARGSVDGGGAIPFRGSTPPKDPGFTGGSDDVA